MSATKTLNVRINADLKDQAEKIFTELGIPTSTAINMFFKAAVRCGGLPLDLRLKSSNLETLAAIDDVNNNRNMSKTFSSVEELMDDLNA